MRNKRTNRRVVADLWTPTGVNRRDRRNAKRAASVLQHADPAEVEARNNEPATVKFPPPPYGRAGENRPEALRNPRRFGVPSHRATTAIVSKAYPFLAEGGLGSEGVYVGTDVHAGGAFVYDPWVLYKAGVLTNPNALIAGVVGSGKSSLAKSIACRSIAFGRRVYVPTDPKGEWTSVARQVGGNAITLGPGLSHRLNPLDPGPRPRALGTAHEAEWQSTVASRRRSLLGALVESVLDRPLGPLEHTALDVALGTAANEHASSDRRAVPVLPVVVDALFAPAEAECDRAGMTVKAVTEYGIEVAHGLRRLVSGDLAGMFDGPSTVTVDPSSPMVTVDLSALEHSAPPAAMRVALTCASTWMESAIADPDGGHRWIIYDEAWRILADPALLSRMQAQWKLSRAWGIANLMVIHRLSDLEAAGAAGSKGRALAEGLLADCSTRVIYRQETDQIDSSAHLLGLTDVERQAILELPMGRGLWKVRDRSFVVQHRMHTAELAAFDTNARMSDLTPELSTAEDAGPVPESASGEVAAPDQREGGLARGRTLEPDRPAPQMGT